MLSLVKNDAVRVGVGNLIFKAHATHTHVMLQRWATQPNIEIQTTKILSNFVIITGPFRHVFYKYGSYSVRSINAILTESVKSSYDKFLRIMPVPQNTV